MLHHGSKEDSVNFSLSTVHIHNWKVMFYYRNSIPALIKILWSPVHHLDNARPETQSTLFIALSFPLDLYEWYYYPPGLADGCHCTQWMCLFCLGTCSLFLPWDHDSPDATFIFILIIACFLPKQRIGRANGLACSMLLPSNCSIKHKALLLVSFSFMNTF